MQRPPPIRSIFGRLCLGVGLAAAAAGLAAAGEAPNVPTLVVGRAAGVGSFELEGTLQAARQSTVAAQVSGNVLELAVKAGDRVRRGQVIARIDEREVQAALARGDAAVAQARAELRNAQVGTDRTRELRAQGFVSQAALDTSQTQLEAAQAGLRQAEASRTQAALARSFANVVAPFDALVLSTDVEPGDLASPGRPLATLYAPGLIRASVQLPSSRSAAARAAARVEVRLPDGRWIEPARRTELPGADPVSQTVEWRLDLPGPAAAPLVPGTATRVRFVAARRAKPAADEAAGVERLTVPAATVLRRGELTAVYVVQDGRFVLKPVRLGATLGDSVEVVAGLRNGERIALDPVRAGLSGAAAQ